MIDQTKLIHDRLSLSPEFDVTGIEAEAVLSHSWHAVTNERAEQALEYIASEPDAEGRPVVAVARMEGCAWIALAN